MAFDAQQAQRALHRVRRLRLQEVDAQLLRKGWSPQEVAGLREETLRFLSICSTGTGYTPSQIVDEYWHALILHTKLYARVCAALGRFVDHNPVAKPQQQDYARTLRAYVSAFGRVNANYWQVRGVF